MVSKRIRMYQLSIFYQSLRFLLFAVLGSLTFVGVANSGTEIPPNVINLGETPWLFHRIDNSVAIDFSAELYPVITKDDESGYHVSFSLKENMNPAKLKLRFVDKDILFVHYLLEGQKADGTWSIIANQLENSKRAIPILTETVDTIGNTTGLVRKQSGVYVSDLIQGEYKSIRISQLVSKAKNARKVIDEIPKVELVKTVSTKEFASVDADDNNWESVGIPHCFNDNDTYLNANKMVMWRGEVWYRKHFKLATSQKNKNFILEFQGVNLGAAVYVNGQFMEGNTSVKQNDEVTHVGGFLPFTLDVTSKLKFGQDNIIAVRVSNESDGFFASPGFGSYEGFGMGWGGIVCPVYLHECNSVHIPLNAFSPKPDWGNYITTFSASEKLAEIRILTNVVNNSSLNEEITLQAALYDANNKLVESTKEKATVPANGKIVFDFNQTIKHPNLWFPNNSPYGKPYLYTLKTTVFKGKKLIDEKEDKVGIRTITWDADYCFVNGKKHFLKGFGNRNTYPALGSAVPAELQWKDIELIAACGGNALRVGHVPATIETVKACDAYGILLFQNSGDNEWVLKGEPTKTYKAEYDREMITAFRNHPSIAIWESNNGLPRGEDAYFAINTYNIAQELDSLSHRIIHNRDSYPKNWPDSLRVMVGYTNGFRKVEGSPTLNTEVYGARWGGKISWNIARNDYANEVTFTDYFVKDYIDDINAKACGWIDWMLAETQGEGYTIYLNGISKQKSLGSSAMDGNRFPKLNYQVYKNALWIPYETKPGVCLQSSWNLSGIQTVCAWSNCAVVELFLNGESLGKRSPDQHTKKCDWENIEWKPGELKAVGFDASDKEVCADSKFTAGTPHHIELTVEPNLQKPDGSKFLIQANGSDAAIITARILDVKGNLCVDAGNTIRFSVEGPAVYRGSYNFYIIPEKSIYQNAPGDTQLKAEGGLMRIAVKSKFDMGKVRVKAAADGLQSAETTYSVQPLIEK